MISHINVYLFVLFRIFILCFGNQTNISYINRDDFSIQNAIYIIRNREGNLNLDIRFYPKFINDIRIPLKANFEIIKDKENNDTEEYFYVRRNSDSYIVSSKDDTIITSNKFSNIVDNDYKLWRIIPKINNENKLIYYVQNKKNKKFWEFDSSNQNNFKLSEIKDMANLNNSNEFQFIELYKNVEKKESKLLDDEPIDVFIKYIDLTDTTLNREGIPQIKKDYDNEELRYSVRSILKNIPWIRKIFILMPNNKVKYFKSPEEIKEKIVYIKDKDLLGFDTASIYVFLFNLYKMKKFGLSENFILMDDDYFIAQPLNKDDFFYEENGTVYPALVTSDYYEMNKGDLQNRINTNLLKRRGGDPHSDIGFYIQQSRALKFMYTIFGNDDIRYGKKLIEPAFSHNAIPVKMSDIEEMYYYLNNYYEYRDKMLTSLIRTNFDLQMHTAYMAYVKNKYDRKVSKISSSFYDLTQTFIVSLDKAKLFVINTSSKNYISTHYQNEKKLLNRLFPTKTEYELDEQKENKEENKEVNKEDNKKINIEEFKEELKKEINIKLEQEYEKVKELYSNYTNQTKISYNTIKEFNDNISILFSEMKDKIDEITALINDSKKNQNLLENNTSNYNNIINDQINRLKRLIIFQNNVNYFLIGFILLYIISKIYYICKNPKKKSFKEDEGESKTLNTNE